MRNIIRWLAVAALFAFPLSIALVQAQDPTAQPTGEATVEATSDATMEVTAEPTMEMTAEMTVEATADTSSQPAQSTAMPTAEATIEATTASSTGSTVATGGMVTCDSDLILNLYIAERYFGFAGVMDAAMAGNTTGTSAFVDVATIDKGQYTPLFNNMMSMMDSNMMMSNSMMTQEQMQTLGSMMNMDQTAMMDQMATMMPPGTDMNSMTTLSTVSIAGEPEECTMLRAELNRFNSLIAFNDIQSANMQSAMGTGAEATRSADTGATTGTTMNFSTTLSGANEVSPADPDGTGIAALTVDMANTQICYTLSVQNIALPAVAAHIHRGAAGEKGDVVVPFDLAPDANGNATSCVKVDPALLNEIATNPAGFYVNVHSSEFPDGAVRGQVSG